MPHMHSLVPPAIRAQVSAAVALLNEHLGDAIVGLHLFGSAVDGGLQPFSDIDLLVTLDAPPPPATRRALMDGLLALSAPPGSADRRALEVTVLALPEVVPWRYPPRRELQFGEWLRADIEAGVFEGPMPDRDLAILLTKVRQHSLCLRGRPARELFDPVPHADLVRALQDTVAQWNGPEDWAGDERNIVLALARIWYTAETGAIGSKAHAAGWLLERLGEGAHHAVLARARAAYLGMEKDGLAKHPDELADCIRAFRHAVEARCAAASGPPAPEQ